MPYIKQEDRVNLDFPLVKAMETTEIGTCGNLNYLITKLCHKFLSEGKQNYEKYNSIIGVLECAKLEYYRRQVSPYEDVKIAENGDV